MSGANLSLIVVDCVQEQRVSYRPSVRVALWLNDASDTLLLLQAAASRSTAPIWCPRGPTSLCWFLCTTQPRRSSARLWTSTASRRRIPRTSLSLRCPSSPLQVSQMAVAPSDDRRASLSDLASLPQRRESVLHRDDCPLLRLANRPPGGPDLLLAIRRRTSRPPPSPVRRTQETSDPCLLMLMPGAPAPSLILQMEPRAQPRDFFVFSPR